MRLVILDRDGVINHDSDEFIKSPDEWIALPGSLEAIARLNRHGYCVVVATNQSGLARGLFDLDTLNRIHEKMQLELSDVGGHIDMVLFCPHGPDDDCECRKPKPGMIKEIASRLDMSFQGVWLVGDSLRDLQAAQAAGVAPILVRTGKGERTLEKNEGLEGVPVYDDLAMVVDVLLNGEAV